MKRVAFVVLSAVAVSLSLALSAGQARDPKALEIYVVDTEGGKAMLFLSPAGQSLLIDSGNPGGRDTDRIMEVVNQVGLKQIDYLLSTHYHVDHIGGMAELAKRIPIANYIDHGPTVEEREQVASFQQTYADLRSKAKHIVVKPGDRVPIAGLDWRIVTSAGAALKQPLAGGGRPNPACDVSKPRKNARDENAQSVGSVIAFGQFRAIDLGDLTWDNELELMCPNNPIGTVDLYLVSHHGLDASGSEALVHGVRPRVAVMQNGTRKGAGVQAMPIMRSSPGLEDIWQLHWSYTAGIEQNSAGAFVANLEDPATLGATLAAPPRGGGGGGRGQGGGVPGGVVGPPPGTPPAAGPPPTPPAPTTPTTPPQPPMTVVTSIPNPTGTPPAGPPAVAPPAGAGQGGGRGGAAAAHTPAHWIKISAQSDGTFTVSNSRNGFSKTYLKR
jgi:beta-lactamase superfamily II metal-dependent hydrolase